MTCVVGTKSRSGVIIAADSLGSAGWDCEVRRDPKVGRVKEYVFGYCGSFRLGQVLLYDFDPPIPPKRKAPDVYRFLVSEFIPVLREECNRAGLLHKDDNVEGLENSSFLIGIYSNLFYVEGDFQVGWPHHPYASVGCGAPYALGAMYAGYKAKKRGEDLLMLGLVAAETYSNGVRSPFIFESN